MTIAPAMSSFICRKTPARGAQGMVVTNHPVASATASQILLEGGNAMDATVAALFALTVVEPMMVGLLGGGLTHLRTPDGRHRIIDNLSCAPLAATESLYRPLTASIAHRRLTQDRANEWGALAVAVPGALAGWCQMLAETGSMALDSIMAPAIRLADKGFRVTPYLATNIAEQALPLSRDPVLVARFFPEGAMLRAGDLLKQPHYADTLRMIAAHGPQTLYGGELGRHLVAALAKRGGILQHEDLVRYRVRDREPVRGHYRGITVIGPPPPASSGVHIVQMLNLLEAFEMDRAGFGSVLASHLLAEVMAIGFTDRALATADPDFVNVPVSKLISADYANQRRAQIDLTRASQNHPPSRTRESPDTTHLTIADAQGNIVASTQTLNSAFGACLAIGDTGMIANNYMYNFDPHPGCALSIAPGKRVFTSMAPMMLLKAEQPWVALGLPGGLRIFPSAMQTIVNLIDHRMSLQQAVEAPRLFSEGDVLEIENDHPSELADALAAMGHRVARVPRVGGGMNAISFDEDGMMTGAACWRADGTPVAIGGGLARANIGFGRI